MTAEIFSLISTLNVNELNSPMKRQVLAESVEKHDLMTGSSTRGSF